jgi:hypothetical protein
VQAPVACAWLVLRFLTFLEFRQHLAREQLQRLTDMIVPFLAALLDEFDLVDARILDASEAAPVCRCRGRHQPREAKPTLFRRIVVQMEDQKSSLLIGSPWPTKAMKRNFRWAIESRGNNG